MLDWSNPPFAKWFIGGELNVAYNCVDRHVEAGHGDKVAIHWEGEPGDTRTITYAELLKLVSQAANTLTELGITAGDRVAIYLPMIPEAAVAMLACARIGATHSVVFGGFSVDALSTRIKDADAKLVITADGGYRRGKPSALKPTVDEAVAQCPSIENVLVVRRTGQDVAWTDKDKWWHETVEQASPEHKPQPFDAEHPLFILYTSGTTGKPKGILHTTGGYLTQTSYTHYAVFDLKPETDVYWCTADIGWVTGHSYIVYGPLSNGATQVMYEGTPDTPDRDRFWELVDKYKVSILYTAPTLIRTMMKWGDDIPAELRPVVAADPRQRRRADQPRGLDVVPRAHRPQPHPGRGHLVADRDRRHHDLAAARRDRGQAGLGDDPAAGISADVVDDKAQSVPNGGGGFLVLREPWPSMLRTIWGDDERFIDTYWSRFGAGAGSTGDDWIYFAGDGAKRDSDGSIWLLGRVDDVMLISGHNISTTEVESALVSHPSVAEAAVVGATDPTTGQAIVAFVIPRGNVDTDGDKGEQLNRGPAQPRGQEARPDRQAAADHAGGRAAEDPVRQDHAAAAQGRGREPLAGRRHHAAGLRRDGPDRFGDEDGKVRGLS